MSYDSPYNIQRYAVSDGKYDRTLGELGWRDGREVA
jgi:hypothetical protein